MSDILSQEEIDALLNALNSGGIQADSGTGSIDPDKASKVRPYDFYRPSKFSKEQIRTIYILHETFGRLWSSTLSGVLRNYVSISVSSVDQVTYAEFMQSIPNPTIIATFSLQPLEGKGLVEFATTIGLPIVDRLLGGQGLESTRERELTDIEKNVLSGVIDESMVFLKEAWGTMIDLHPELLKIEANPLFVQVVPPSDMVLLISLELRIGSLSGLLNVVYPYILLEPILGLLSAETLYAVGVRGASEEVKQRTRGILGNVNVPVNVELGRTEVTIAELLALEPGDIIRLHRRTDEDLEVHVGGIGKFRCTPGLVGKNMGARITEVELNSEVEPEALHFI
jgi:flagellar motor switch protein FliM